MEYDRGNSFPFDFEPNEILFVSKLKCKLARRSYSSQYERKEKSIFLADVCYSRWPDCSYALVSRKRGKVPITVKIGFFK